MGALRYVAGAEKALAELDSLGLDRYHLYHANPSEQALLEQRLRP
ncbi:hypothetical protein SK803_31975 [Lentzea sp. BCCO 10_0856]|uniref:Uncharacterized protein n=1 Tax=Lentzea miocenica TaxID=3095431 RepID=A0ABU4T9L4_9PSEU|nr:hypothetical protein [Lentzea sp. BCCO 10_0856]MDX8034859.1 hypothetical protein [Lentzea sp. BCCO 10_0856]